MFRDRTEEWFFPQQASNKRARYLLGMNETAPPGETESSLRYYGMGDVRCVHIFCFACQLQNASIAKVLH